MIKDLEEDEDIKLVVLNEAKKENLELLLEELILVFDYENLGKSSNSQKEDLMQRVL